MKRVHKTKMQAWKAALKTATAENAPLETLMPWSTEVQKQYRTQLTKST